MAEEIRTNTLLNNVAILAEPENFQKYILGTKKNGHPRAVYDVVRDFTVKPKKKKKKHDKKGYNSYQLYVNNKKKKKHKKHKKHWHI